MLIEPTEDDPITALVVEAATLWSTTRRGYKEGMLRVGHLLHRYVLGRLAQGDGMSEANRIMAGAVRQGATADAAARLGISVFAVNNLIRAWAAVDLFSDGGETGGLAHSCLRVFGASVRRAGKGKGIRRGRFDGGVPASELERWVPAEDWAGPMFRRAVAEGWNYSRTRTEVLAARRVARGDPPDKRGPGGRPRSLVPAVRPTRDPLDAALTTGRVAKMMRVAPRTVAKMCDQGRLPSYKIPGSQDRRVIASGLVRVMQEAGMPVPQELMAGTILGYGLHEGDRDQIPGVRSVDCPFELGILLSRERVRVLVVSDAVGHSAGVRAVGIARREQPGALIVYVAPTDVGAADDVPGASAVVDRPVDWTALGLDGEEVERAQTA